MYDSEEYGLAAHSAFVAVSINASINNAWHLLARAENKLFRDSDQWPFGLEVLQFDTTPNSIRSGVWLTISRIGKKGSVGVVKALLRALQLGNRTEEAEVRTKEVIQECSRDRISDEFINQIATAFYLIYEIWDAVNEPEIAKLCYDKAKSFRLQT